MSNITEKGYAETFESIFLPKDKKIFIKVPDYQRAYSWEEKQIKLFISDLKKYVGKPYYFGHFILEYEPEKSQENIWKLVDGQQRMTTLILFLMVCRMHSNTTSIVAFELIERFSTVKYDSATFEKIAKKLQGRTNISASLPDYKENLKDSLLFEFFGLDSECYTRSQRRMIMSILQFNHAFRQDGELSLASIPDYINVIMHSLCSHHLTCDKSVAASIFEMHNTRGVPLTTIEIVKAKLMKFVYDHGEDKKNQYVEEIENEFGDIYAMEENLSMENFRGKLTLDHLLKLHLRVIDDGNKILASFHKNQNSSELMSNPMRNANANQILDYIDNKLQSQNVKYAINLAKEFKNSVRIISQHLPECDKKSEHKLVGDVMILEPDWSCEFFLIVCRKLENNSGNANGMLCEDGLKLWEKFLFIRDFHGDYYYAKGSRDKFSNFYRECILSNNFDVKSILVKYVDKGFRPEKHSGSLTKAVFEYLNQKNVNEMLMSNAYHAWTNKAKYAIYKYELPHHPNLRSIVKRGATLEHILPQNWLNINDPNVSSLSEEERKQIDQKINGIGNLLLLTQSQNSSESDKHPSKKRYTGHINNNENNKDWSNAKDWGKLIEIRGQYILDFVKKYFLSEFT